MAEASYTPPSLTLKEKVRRMSEEFDVPFEVVDSVITNESRWGEKRMGDDGCAFGLLHINICENPDITQAQAEDDDFSLNYFFTEVKAGREWKWSICNCVSYLRIKGIKLPRVGDIKNLVTNSPYPKVGGAVKLVYSNGRSHGARVEEVTSEGIWVTQYNKPRCQFSKEFIRFDSGLIEGYWYDTK